MRVAWATGAVAVLVASGCSNDEDRPRPRIGLAPAYPAETTTTGPVGAPASVLDAGAGGTTTVGPAAGPGAVPAPGGPAAPPTSASFTDPTGDLTLSVDPPPRYADLAGATLTRSAAGFELRVRVAGPVPATGSSDRTLNLASFYDVSGDGVIDYEVWLNLAGGGWGGAYFDRTRRRGNRFGDEAEVTIEVAGNQVVARFPLAHLASAERFRWSLASEWGRYEVIGTTGAARDDGPDGDAPVRFPAG